MDNNNISRAVGADQSNSDLSGELLVPSDINSVDEDPNKIDLSILKQSFLPQPTSNKETYHNTWSFQSLLEDIKQEYQNLNDTSPNINSNNTNKNSN